MTGWQITCANRDQRQQLVRVGGDGWSMTIREVITGVISRQTRLYIRVNENFHDVGVRGEGFDAYLVIEPDGFPLHELYDLPSC